MNQTRRQFLKQSAIIGGAALLLPQFVSCSNRSENATAAHSAAPLVMPSEWDEIAFNTKRALAGAAPTSYHGAIQSADGGKKHVGKHLPFIAQGVAAPAGYVAIMVGDSAKGYARHPNAAAEQEIGEIGHWYDWIKIRPAIEGDAEEVTSSYAAWPKTAATDNGKIIPVQGKSFEDNGGRETVYLAQLPKGVMKGDMLRVIGHCNKHGDYVGFYQL